MGRQAKLKLFAKKNGLIDTQKNGERNGYGIVSQNEEEEVKRCYYYIS